MRGVNFFRIEDRVLEKFSDLTGVALTEQELAFGIEVSGFVPSRGAFRGDEADGVAGGGSGLDGGAGIVALAVVKDFTDDHWEFGRFEIFTNASDEFLEMFLDSFQRSSFGPTRLGARGIP